VEVYLMPIPENLYGSHEVYLIFVHAYNQLLGTSWLSGVSNASLNPHALTPAHVRVRLMFFKPIKELAEGDLRGKIAT
jgi:hypothetical protein